MNIAFAGFRHGHILSLYEKAVENKDVTIVGCYEGNEPARKAVENSHNVRFTYSSYDELLADKNVEAVAIGDYYGIRGQMVIKALKAGKHIICDKPVCTDLKELDEIEKLHKDTGLTVLCMLDMRFCKYTSKAKEIIESGKLGDLKIISFTAQHCLDYGNRPSWYFDEGCHGGTINDIAIHGVDLLRYLTGKNFTKTEYAKTWNAYADKCPHFEDCGQFIADLDGINVISDVSYASPKCNVTLPTYWEFTFWGTKAMMRCNLTADAIHVYSDKEETFPVEETDSLLLECLMDEMRGVKTIMDTDDILKSQRQVLEIQKFADNNK